MLAKFSEIIERARASGLQEYDVRSRKSNPRPSCFLRAQLRQKKVAARSAIIGERDARWQSMRALFRLTIMRESSVLLKESMTFSVRNKSAQSEK